MNFSQMNLSNHQSDYPSILDIDGPISYQPSISDYEIEMARSVRFKCFFEVTGN